MNAIPLRKYDKGDRRVKHVHNQPFAAILLESGNPKRPVGKCPNKMSGDLLGRLINEAISSPNHDVDLEYSKKIYVVHEGVIYEAQSSDRGKSYHGYPFTGRLSSRLIEQLRLMAQQKQCEVEFDKWVSKYIDKHGR